MQKSGIVQEVLADNKVRVMVLADECVKDEHCHECGMCGKSSEGHNFELIVDNFLGVSSGSRVELEVEVPRMSVIAILIYLLPLVLLFAGGIGGNELAGTTGMLIGGAAGFALAFLIVYYINKTIFRLSGKIISVS